MVAHHVSQPLCSLHKALAPGLNLGLNVRLNLQKGLARLVLMTAWGLRPDKVWKWGPRGKVEESLFDLGRCAVTRCARISEWQLEPMLESEGPKYGS